MSYGPYIIRKATMDPTTGKGEAMFADGERLLFTVRTWRGKRRYRLLTPRHEIGVCCPPRLKSVVGWVSEHFSPETLIAA